MKRKGYFTGFTKIPVPVGASAYAKVTSQNLLPWNSVISFPSLTDVADQIEIGYGMNQRGTGTINIEELDLDVDGTMPRKLPIIKVVSGTVLISMAGTIIGAGQKVVFGMWNATGNAKVYMRLNRTGGGGDTIINTGPTAEKWIMRTATTDNEAAWNIDFLNLINDSRICMPFLMAVSDDFPDYTAGAGTEFTTKEINDLGIFPVPIGPTMLSQRFYLDSHGHCFLSTTPRIRTTLELPTGYYSDTEVDMILEIVDKFPESNGVATNDLAKWSITTDDKATVAPGYPHVNLWFTRSDTSGFIWSDFLNCKYKGYIRHTH